MKKYWAIGDIHGCSKELRYLWQKILEGGLNPEKDTVVFLGDYIDRGPDTPGVVEYLFNLQKKFPHFVFLTGNHEDLMADALFNNSKLYGEGCWEGNGGNKTLAQYNNEIPDHHLRFLIKTPRFYYETPDYFFVHGGVIPEHPLKDSFDYPQTMIWVRNEFHRSQWDWGKKIIFGHTPFKQVVTMDNKIGIDGGCCNGGYLRALELPAETIYEQRSLRGN